MQKKIVKKILLFVSLLCFGMIVCPAAAENVSQDRLNKALMDAVVKSDNIQEIRRLLESKANVNYCNIRNEVKPLWVCTKNGYGVVIGSCLKKGVHCNKVNNIDGQTPLHVAAHQGHTLIVKYLIEQRACIGKVDKNGKTPFFVAIENGHVDVVKCFELAGATITNLQELLLAAAQGGKVGLLDYLIEKRADVNYISKDDCTALYLAAYNGHKETAEHLIAAGAYIDVAGPSQVTPLELSASRGHVALVSLLLDAHCLRLIAPLCVFVKNVDAIIKQEQKNNSQVQTKVNAHFTLSADEINLDNIDQNAYCESMVRQVCTIEQLPFDCLSVVICNLSPESFAYFRQVSKICRNASYYDYGRRLRNLITLKKEKINMLVAKALAHAEKSWESNATRVANGAARENNVAMPENYSAILALLGKVSERDFWQEAVDVQPICAPSGRTVMSDACYEELYARKIKNGASGCALS